LAGARSRESLFGVLHLEAQIAETPTTYMFDEGEFVTDLEHALIPLVGIIGHYKFWGLACA
jgi:hypothetical protein